MKRKRTPPTDTSLPFSNFARVGISTFTHFGRHAQTIKSLINRLHEEPHFVLDMGSGFIEPFLFAELLVQRFKKPKAIIEAVDEKIEYIDLINRLLSGEAIRIDTLVHCANDTDQRGKIIPNENFSHRFWRSIQDYSDTGLDPYRMIDETHTYFRYTGPASHLIKPICTRIEDYLASLLNQPIKKQYDLCYAGALFINILKLHNLDYMTDIVRKIYKVMSPRALFGIGTSPSALYTNVTELHAILDACFQIVFISAENLLVESEYGIFGDYAIVVAKDPQYLLSTEEQDAIDFKIKCDPILGTLPFNISFMKQNEFLSYLATEQRSLLLAAVCLPNGQYRIWEIEKKYILANSVFQERYLLNLIIWPSVN